MFDIAIVGGGIVGLSTGLAIMERFPRARLVIIEKEIDLAQHQTGRNSGVIHSGIYYEPGSLKARFAREGNKALVAFCKKHKITYEMCGKVIVATTPDELLFMDKLYARGLENGLSVKKIGLEQLRKIEPHVAGLGAIHVKDCGIVNYETVARTFANLITNNNGEIRLSTEVRNIHEEPSGVTIETTQGTIQARFLVNCAGLQSDRIAKMSGLQTGMKIVPFRGEYYELVPEKRNLVNNLIYPVPNPDFPFLGVHFTRMITNDVHAGPNAVLALKREGYLKTNFNIKDTYDVLAFPGFWKMAIPNIKEGSKEMLRSLSKRAFLKSLQRLIPELKASDIIQAGAGVRAQALTDTGEMVDDFAFFSNANSLHVCNAPSPAATASIMIGEEIVKQFPERIVHEFDRLQRDCLT